MSNQSADAFKAWTAGIRKMLIEAGEKSAAARVDNYSFETFDAGWQARAASPQPAALTVWYGSMPESNGKSNWTAILHKGDIASGMTIDRSEYPDRVRYEADRVRWLIGELSDEPWILDYDADKHSGYVAPKPPPFVMSLHDVADMWNATTADSFKDELMEFAVKAINFYKESRPGSAASPAPKAQKPVAWENPSTFAILRDESRDMCDIRRKEWRPLVYARASDSQA